MSCAYGAADEWASVLLPNRQDLIQGARQRALRAVDAVQFQTCWEIDRHIVERGPTEKIDGARHSRMTDRQVF